MTTETKRTKLEFKPAVMNAQDCYLAEPYKVEIYDYTWVNGVTILKPCFAAYHRIKNKRDGTWLFGNSCEYDANGHTMFYDTKEQAMDACQRHFDKEVK